MKIMRWIVAVVLLAMAGGVASAQQSKSDETQEFRPHWSLGLQGGVAYTLGEYTFGELISPAASLSAQWHFHHALGLRLGVSGWQGKGAVLVPEVYTYGFKYAQVNADLVVDLANLIGGFDHARICSPYVFAGLGGAYGFNNKEAAAVQDILPYYWENKFFVPGRAGLGVDFRLGNAVSLGIEGGANLFNDKFNSKQASHIDWQFNALAGVKVRLGSNTRPSKVYADKIAAEEAALEAERVALLAAEKAAAEKAAAEKAAAEKAAAEKAAAEKAAAEKAAAERVAAGKAAYEEANVKNVYFVIGSAKIRKLEDEKIVAISEFLKQYPEFALSIVGYADAATGTKPRNLELSKLRAEAVYARLVDLGIDPSRISIDYKGSSEQLSPKPVENRVAICVLK